MSNLRIKNKRLRRELERLKNQTVKLTTIYDQPNIIKLGAVINFPKDDLPFVNERVVRNLLIDDMKKEIGKCIEITSQPSVDIPDGVMYKGFLEVVNINKEMI